MKGIHLFVIIVFFGKSGWSQEKITFSPELVKRAKAADAWAQFDLARCYYNGASIDKDYKEAVKWYTKSADQGNAWAQFDLARCYYNGAGVVKDYKEAVKWYTKSSEQGNECAQYDLNRFYRNGKGLPQDKNEAKKLFVKVSVANSIKKQEEYVYTNELDLSADQGDVKSKYKIAMCYLFGKGVPVDFKKAWDTFNDCRTELERLSREGDVDATKMLADYFANGRGKEGKDYIKARGFYFEASKKNDPESLFKLGKIYENGLGTTKDNQQAELYYKKASDMGYTPGCLRLAQILIAKKDRDSFVHGFKLLEGNSEAGKQFLEDFEHDLKPLKKYQEMLEQIRKLYTKLDITMPQWLIPDEPRTKTEKLDPRVEKIHKREIEYGGHRYVFIPERKTWKDAEKNARSMGGYLVVITSQNEQKLIKALISTNGKIYPTWIGLTDENQEGVFKWVTGEQLEYVNWGTNNPDNGKYEGITQNYAWIGYRNWGKWDDTWGFTPLFSVVEFDSTNIKTDLLQSPTNPQQNP